MFWYHAEDLLLPNVEWLPLCILLMHKTICERIPFWLKRVFSMEASLDVIYAQVVLSGADCDVLSFPIDDTTRVFFIW